MGIKGWAQRFISSVYAYRNVFVKDNPDVKTVLADLAKFAPIDPTRKVAKPYNENSNEVMIMIGRRQVISYILGKINMTDEELTEIVKQEKAEMQKNNIL